ncbi:MAG: hypothetical protein AAFO07_34150 [Bacteroidota bacterium]
MKDNQLVRHKDFYSEIFQLNKDTFKGIIFYAKGEGVKSFKSFENESKYREFEEVSYADFMEARVVDHLKPKIGLSQVASTRAAKEGDIFYTLDMYTGKTHLAKVIRVRDSLPYEVQLDNGDIINIIGLFLELVDKAKLLWLAIKAAFGNKNAKDQRKAIKNLKKNRI